MNYALDALWWSLTHSATRDLAALLTAPSLWTSGCELPVATLLGEHGFRYLLQLDAHTEPLDTWLANRPTVRLGNYAEHLLAFWFTHAPHSHLHAHNLPVRSGSRLLGALDFIVALSGSLYHIELTVKYYGSHSGLPDTLHGFNPNDTLLGKAQKLQQQQALIHTPEAATALLPYGITADQLHCASIIRGNAFNHSGSLPSHPLLPVNAWNGLFINRLHAAYALPTHARFHHLDRQRYLSPARVSGSQTLSRDQVAAVGVGLFAQVLEREDGFWHENQRIMVR